MKRQKLVVFDGNAIVHRAYHALPPMTTKNGELVNAAYGYASIILKVLAELKPDYTAVAFDVAAPTFRHQEYELYKANRPKGPDELYDQFGRVREITESLSIPIFEKAGYEADDVIGCLARQAPENVETIIVTGDLDELQLVDEKTKVYTMKRGFTDTVIYDEKVILEKYGFSADKFVDYKALRGDPSDNIPGVAGVGEKTAMTLIQKYGSTEKIYENIDEISGSLKDKLIAGKENAFLSKRLSKIVCDAAIGLDLDKCLTHEFDRQKVFELFRELGFKSLLNKLPSSARQEDLFAGDQAKEASHITDSSYKVIDDVRDLSALCEQLSKSEVVSIDTETNSVVAVSANLVGISISKKEGEAFYIPVAHTHGKQIKKEEILRLLGPIFKNEKIKKVGHNLKYDYIVLKNYGLEMSGIDFDTMIAAYLLNQNLRSPKLSDLAFSELGLEMIGIEEVIGDGKNQITFDQAEIQDSYKYACEDADIAFRLYEHLSKELEEKKLGDLFSKIEMPLVKVLASMEISGISLDAKKLNKMSSDFKSRITDIEEKIYKISGKSFNINSPSQLQDVLFGILKLQEKIDDKNELKKVKNGGYSTGAGELEKLKDTHEIISEIIKYRELTKLKNTYIDTLPKLVNKTTGRIHTSFNQAVAATGRLSSSDPNLQNIPIRSKEGMEIRSAFVASEGKKLVSVDYSQIELRVIADLSKDPTMTETFLKNEDIHTITAAKVFGVENEKVTKDMRRIAKAVNFGIIYGVSPHGLKQSTGMSREEASDFIDKYFEIHKTVRKYLDELVEQARKKGYAESLFGRRRYLPEINSSNAVVRSQAERMALNMPIQGTAADIMKIAMIKIDQELPQKFPEAKMILQVHDELVFEVPANMAEELKGFVCAQMESAVKLSIPITAEAGIGDNWAECK